MAQGPRVVFYLRERPDTSRWWSAPFATTSPILEIIELLALLLYALGIHLSLTQRLLRAKGKSLEVAERKGCPWLEGSHLMVVVGGQDR